MSENMNEELDLVTAVDEDGNEVTLRVMDYFFYQGDEYAILADYDEETDEEAEDVDCFVMKIVPSEDDEEMEDFIPVEDAALEAKLIEIATTKLSEDEEADE